MCEGVEGVRFNKGAETGNGSNDSKDGSDRKQEETKHDVN